MSDAVGELASLFEMYRIHYGQSPAPAATRAWVGEMARSGELEFYGAYHGPRMVGFAAIHQVPASLGLGRFWQLRDLFADPAVRRQGVARGWSKPSNKPPAMPVRYGCPCKPNRTTPQHSGCTASAVSRSTPTSRR
jgi:hypothetical protein